MSPILLGIVLLQIFSGALAVGLAVTAFRRRTLAGWPAVYFGLSALAVAIYAWGYACEISSRSLPVALAWVKVEYLGIPFIMPTWLLFVLAISGHERWITRRRVLALLVVPLMVQAALFTTERHTLYYLSPHLQAAGPLLILTFGRGPLYWLGTLYDNLGLIFITALLAQMAARSAPAFRRQAATFLLGTIIQWAGLAVFVAGFAPYNLDLSSMSMSLCLVVFALGLFRFGGLEVVPLARDVVFERMGDGVLVLDALDRLIDFNPAARSLLPELRPALVGAPVAGVLAAYPALLEQIAASAPGLVALVLTRAESAEPCGVETAEPCYAESQVSMVLDWRKQPAGKIVTLHDTTQTQRLLDQMRDLAIHDGLTGLCNWRYFSELAEHEIERLRRHEGAIALICLDLDHFKQVNDTYGHAAGDAVLKAAAALCLRSLRKVDVVGRMGGEEFAALLPDTGLKDALAITERLREALAQLRVTYAGQEIRVTASFGVAAQAQAGGMALEALLRAADQAMYLAKAAGRNRVWAAPPEA